VAAAVPAESGDPEIASDLKRSSWQRADVKPSDAAPPEPPNNDPRPCPTPDALGTSRVLRVGTVGGLHVGLKSYPQTLALEDHEVILTFDDGPNPATTDRVLRSLQDQCVKATFFLIGINAAAHQDLVRRELAEGHSIGTHSWSHPTRTLRGIAESDAVKEITKGLTAVQEAAYGAPYTGGTPRVPFFRFPGFADTPALRDWLDKNNIGIFGTDLWASDWNPMTPNDELKLITERLDAAGRGIILFHDTREETAAMLPKFLRALKAKGYKVVHIEPGPGPVPELAAAPAGWHSETEDVLAKVMPGLMNPSRRWSRTVRTANTRVIHQRYVGSRSSHHRKP
jgi:peptidoglycan-N-acetylglucosamine deacetylase